MSDITDSYFTDDTLKAERTAIEASLEEKVSSDISGLPAEMLLVLTEAFLNYRSTFDSSCAGFLAALIFTMAEFGIAPAPVESIDRGNVDRYVEALRGLAESLTSYEADKRNRQRAREEANGRIAEQLIEAGRTFFDEKAKKDSALPIAA